MFGIGIQEFGLILVVALLVFGPKRLPELARTLGRGLGEFRRASNDLRQSLALDDLQDDLRKDLHSAGSILKPQSPPTRPAQAGDSLRAKAAAGTGAAATASSASPENVAQPVEPHPGELPLDNDHEHNADPFEAADTDSPAASPTAESASSDTAKTGDRDTADAQENELGAVPVAGSDPRRD